MSETEVREVNTPEVRGAIAAVVATALPTEQETATDIVRGVFVILDRASAGLDLRGDQS